MKDWKTGDVIWNKNEKDFTKRVAYLLFITSEYVYLCDRSPLTYFDDDDYLYNESLPKTNEWKVPLENHQLENKSLLPLRIGSIVYSFNGDTTFMVISFYEDLDEDAYKTTFIKLDAYPKKNNLSLGRWDVAKRDFNKSFGLSTLPGHYFDF